MMFNQSKNKKDEKVICNYSKKNYNTFLYSNLDFKRVGFLYCTTS